MEIASIDYKNELILLVDDDKVLAITFEKLLENLGLETKHVGAADAALIELTRNKQYTFLITDIVMPGMDGLELTKSVKNNYPDMCVIVMTGYSDQYDYRDVVDAGATDFINKPFNIDELEAKIRRGIIERNTQIALKELCITDDLTGLYNQRHFFARLNEEIMRTRRRKQHLSLILFDLDDFKRYNDENGHLAGDTLLKNFGEIISSQIRQGMDSGYRYGGDEFAVISCQVGSDSCKIVGERIADRLKMKYGVSVSMGYSLFSEEMTLKSFIRQTDRNLYKFKGRNNAFAMRDIKMIDFIKNFFGKTEKSDTEDLEGNSSHNIHIAACALLLEMSNIDGEFSESERKHILSILKKHYQLTDENAAALLEASNEERENSTDLWRFAGLINQNYSIKEKEGVIETIWKVAYADGHLDKHEDYLVHKLAKLLRLSHKQLIAAKLKVLSK